MSVKREQRHLRNSPCPVCGGYDEISRGQGRRCAGFTSNDGMWCHCSREELAGAIAPNDAGLYVHMMRGACNCGTTHAEKSSDIEVTYPYFDEGGELLFEVVRKTGKQFRQRKPDGNGGYEWKLGDVRRVLYRLPQLLGSSPDDVVYIVEGEKDVHTAERLGLVATCNPGGAGKWHAIADCASIALRDRDVVVFRDRDDVGAKHAHQVLDALTTVARSLALVESPVGKDLTDYVESGADADAIMSLPDLRRPRDAAGVDVSSSAPPSEPLADVIPITRVQTSGWRWRSADDVFFGAPKPARWIVRDIGLLPGRPTLLSGASGGAKTIIAQSLLISLATGRPIWDRFMRADAEPIKCAHIDVDLGSDDIEFRYRRLLAGFPGAPIDPAILRANFRLVSFPMPRIDLRKPQTRDILRRELAGMRFCVMDALRGLASGNENDSEFREAVDMLTAVSGDIGVAFFLLHHLGHAKVDQYGKAIEDDSAGRGTTGIKDGSGAVLKITGGRGKRKLRMMKPPGRMGVDWDGKKYDVYVEDVDGALVDNEAQALRVRITPEMSKSQEEIADDAAKAEHVRETQFRDACLGIIRAAPSGMFAGGVERLVTMANAAMKTATGNGGYRTTQARALVKAMVEDEAVFISGLGKASRITATPPAQTSLIPEAAS